MLHPRAPSLRSRHARVHRYLWRWVIDVPRNALRRSVCLLADENRNARHAFAAFGVLELQLARAVFSIG